MCFSEEACGGVGPSHIPEVVLILVELVGVTLEVGTDLVRPEVRPAHEVLDPLAWFRLVSGMGDGRRRRKNI